MSRCKAPEVSRNEAYIEVRRTDEERGQRRRWAFFSILPDYARAFLSLILSARGMTREGSFLIRCFCIT